MLWTEKYRPKTFDDILGNQKEIKLIKNWVEKWKAGTPQKALLLVGPPGTGKTTIAHIIGNEFSDFVELNASDKRSYDILMNTIGEASATKSLFDSEDSKLIILDEIDGISGNDDKGGARAINKIVKEGKHPIIMAANDEYSKRLTSIKPKVQVIKIKKVHTNSIVAFMKRILTKEGIEFENEFVKKLAKQSTGDLRSAINDLQVIAEGKTSLSLDDLKILSEKDQRNNVFDTVRTVLKSKTLTKIKKSMYTDEDPTLVLELIAENIPKEYEHPKEISEAYENIAKADLFFGRARSTRNYGYWKYASDFMGPGVAFSKKETYRKFAKYSGSGAFTLMGRTRGKRNLRDRIADKMALKMHISHKIAFSIFPYFEIIFQNDEMAYEISSFLELEDDEIKRFRRRKIPAKLIKQKEKERAKFIQEKSKDDLINFSNPIDINNDKEKKKEESKPIDKDFEPIKTKKTKESSNNTKELKKENKTEKKSKSKDDNDASTDKAQTSLFNF